MLLVEIYNSKLDRNGNSYSYATITNPQQKSISVLLDCAGNLERGLCIYYGGWAEMRAACYVVNHNQQPIREHKRESAGLPYLDCSEESLKNLLATLDKADT